MENLESNLERKYLKGALKIGFVKGSVIIYDDLIPKLRAADSGKY